MGFVESVCQPSTLRMLICPEASSAQNNIAAVSAGGRNSLGFVPSLKFFVQTFDCICGAYTAPLARRQASEGEQAFSSLFQAVGDSVVLEPPFANEGLAADLYLLGCRRVDHVVVIRGDLVMQALGCMREKVSVLMNRTALDRHSVPDGGNGLVEPRRAVDNQELGSPQSAFDKIVEDSAPGLGALAAAASERR